MNTPVKSLSNLLKSSLKRVEREISKNIKDEEKLITLTAGHLIKAKGKKIRPLLTLIVSKMLNYKGNADVTLAVCIEFIHNATLLHDDVIDASNQRRGKKTANALWGNEASVLVGDFLFARAFELMVETNDIWVLEKLSLAAAQITEGEVKQMSMQGQPDSQKSDYFSVIKGKTGVLFAAAAQTGSKVGKGDNDLCEAFYNYGLALGNAFQIMDDALDYGASDGQIGKDLGDDFSEMKVTLPIILAWHDSTVEEQKFWERTFRAGKQKEGDFQKAKEIIAKYSCIERSLDYAKVEVEKAINSISVIPNSSLKDALVEAAKFACLRDK